MITSKRLVFYTTRQFDHGSLFETVSNCTMCVTAMCMPVRVLAVLAEQLSAHMLQLIRCYLRLSDKVGVHFLCL
jgi:hypothetical protein